MTQQYNNPFGPGTIQVSDESYKLLTMVADVQLVWPFATDNSSDTVASIIDVVATVDGLSIIMPPANAASPGYTTIFANRGGFSVTVKGYDGTTVIGVVPAASIKFFYLTDNTDEEGLWNVAQFGAIGTLLDAASLAGQGTRANGSKLDTNSIVSTVSAAQVPVVATFNAQTIVAVGGTSTYDLKGTFPPGFFFNFANQGTGTAVFLYSDASGTVDGTSNALLQVGESATFVYGGTAGTFYTVGRGRNTLFNFTLLTKAVTGGAVTLTQIEAANIVQKYTGVLASSSTIILPAVVQVYYVTNSTSGAFTMAFKTAGSGSQVIVPANQSVVLFCDGVNVTNASTAVAGITSLQLAQGSNSTPSISFTGDSTTGIFQPVGGSVGITVSTVEKLRVTATATVSTNPIIIAGSSALLQVGYGPSTATPSSFFVNIGDGTVTQSGNKFLQIGRNPSGDVDIDAYEGAVGAANMVFSGSGLEYGRFWAAGVGVQPRFSVGPNLFGQALGVVNVVQGSVTPLPGIVFTNRGSNVGHTTTYDVGGIYANAWRDVANPNIISGISFRRNSAVGGLASTVDIVFQNTNGGSTGTYATLGVMASFRGTDGTLFLGDGVTTQPVNSSRLLAQNGAGSDTSVSCLGQTQGQVAMGVNFSGGTNAFGGPTGAAYLGTATSTPIIFGTVGSPRMFLDVNGTLGPYVDNAYPFGGSTQRWSVVYAASGVITTSDAREKHEVSSSVLGLDFIKALRPVSYKWITGGNTVMRGPNETDEPMTIPRPGKRTHWGFIAQEVKRAVDDAGVDFGGWTQDDVADPASRQGLRYEELIAPMTKAMQEMAQMIDDLKARLTAAGL